jgi:lysophospholipase L1-like esterase
VAENRTGSRQTPRMMAAGLALLLIATLLLAVRAVFHVQWSDTYVSAIVGAGLLGLSVAVFGWSRRRWTAGTLQQAHGGPEPARGARARTALFRIILMTLSVALSLVALEWIARFAFWDIHSSADARTYLALRALPVRSNSLGLRDREIPTKSAGKYRIVVIGDSITWGQGIEENERFTNLIERDLGPTYEVFNFGTRAHDMPEHVKELERALRVSPDFVLLQLYLNDFETRRMMRPVARPLLPWPDIDRRMLASSVLYGLMSTQWHRYQEASGQVESFPHYLERYLGDPNSPDARESFGKLREFLRRTADAGVPTGVVIFPNPNMLGRGYPYAYLHNHMREVCLEEHVDYVDLQSPFAKMGDPRGLWANRFDQHPNARANRRAADELLSKFGPVWRRR